MKMSIFRYRPQDTEDDWEDNAVSNAMAWVSLKFFPSMCGSPTSLVVRATNYFWTSCPCCLFLRGAVVGATVAAVAAVALSYLS